MARVKTEAKQNAILHAASRAFSARDFHDVRTEEIAAVAGIGKGTIYRYFSTKEDLYFATMVRGFEELGAALKAGIPTDASPERRLHHVAQEVLGYFWGHRCFYALLYRNEQRFSAQEARLKRSREFLVQLVEGAIADGVADGTFRPVDPKTAAELFLGMLRAVNLFRRESERVETAVSIVMQIFLRGIEPERPE